PVATVEDVTVTRSGCAIALAIGDVRHDIRYGCDGVTRAAAADAALCVSLLPAMCAASALRLTEPVSSRLLAQLPTVQTIFRGWGQASALYAPFRTVAVEAEAREGVKPTSGGETAAFFSGGVASFYTVLRHHDDVDVLVFVDGF